MELIYHPKLTTHLEQYGITVPLRDDRAPRVFEALCQEFPGAFVQTDIDGWAPLGREQLLSTHSSEFVEDLLDLQRRDKRVIEAYELFDRDGNPNRYRPELAKRKLGEMVEDVLLQAKGTLFACEKALEQKFSFYLGGGMHHAMEETGRGFCLVNDIVISLRELQKKNHIKSAWVIDTDAHKGDGTAHITRGDDSISTLSIHMEKGWPLDVGSGEGPWRTPSNIDIPIAYEEQDCYLEKLERGLMGLAQNHLSEKKLAIVVAGADPYEKDELPSSRLLKLSLSEMLERDKMVYHFLKDRGIPQCWLIAGGYGKESWQIYTQFLSYLMREAE